VVIYSPIFMHKFDNEAEELACSKDERFRVQFDNFFFSFVSGTFSLVPKAVL
jgi:hypothetical protein